MIRQCGNWEMSKYEWATRRLGEGAIGTPITLSGAEG